MEAFLVIIAAVISYTILYFVVKAAVRDGIVEARHINDKPSEPIEGTAISQTVCHNCGKKHDIDYPKCPYCKHS